MKERDYLAVFSVATVLLLAMLALSCALLQTDQVLKLDFDGGTGDEGEALYGLWSVRSGRTLYHDYYSPPHVLTIYMPLHYLVPGLLARLFDTRQPETFVVGRGYVYVLWMGVGLVIYALTRQAGGARQTACLAALLWFGGQLATDAAVSFRPDAAALFLSLAALWVYQSGRQASHVAVAIVLLVAAFLHKHSAVVALAVIVAEEWRRQQRQRALVMAACWVGTVGLTVLGAQLITGGVFAENAFGSLALFADKSRPGFVLAQSMTRGIIAFTGGALGCAMLRTAPNVKLLKQYFGSALLLAFLSSAKFGSGSNYYLEPLALGCVLTGLLLDDWRSRTTRATAAVLRLGWLGLALGAAWVGLVPRLERSLSVVKELVEHRAIRAREARAWDEVLARLSELADPILVENSYLALRLGRTPFMMNASFFAALQHSGRFDDTDVIRRIDTCAFTAIVAARPFDDVGGFRHFPARWIEPMRERYVLADSLGAGSAEVKCYIYRPARTGLNSTFSRAGRELR